MIPVVAHTVADFGERPIANAFGIRVSATATFGFGRSAWMHRRSTIACSSGASAGVTSRAPIARSASLSEPNSWNAARPPAMIATVSPFDARGEQGDDEDDVDEPEQEHRERHPDLEPGVLAE